ncbi:MULTISPECIES: polyketide cyclase [unclassified Streptomyces]|uniref:polyketide cyclase n=1 Tax=unclassified Streptomyces TaxID=2593676 RepID=UPI0033A41277
MSGRSEVTTGIDRPVEDVCAYPAEGRDDPESSSGVLRIDRIPDGPTAVGTVFRSTVKDTGMKSAREFRVTALEAPTRIQRAEVSKNSVTAREGGYDPRPLPDGGTRVRIFDVREDHGIGQLLMGLALAAARKDADAFGARIGAAAEAAIPPR